MLSVIYPVTCKPYMLNVDKHSREIIAAVKGIIAQAPDVLIALADEL
jgi:hypothetical protein